MCVRGVCVVWCGGGVVVFTGHLNTVSAMFFCPAAKFNDR